MRYPTFLSLIIKFPIQMALGCIQYGPTQRKMSMFFSVQSHAFHNIPLKSQRFWRLKHLQPQRFPHSAKPRPLSQRKRGYLFLAWPIPKSYGYPILSPSYKIRFWLVKSLYLETMGPGIGCMTWGPILFCLKGSPNSRTIMGVYFMCKHTYVAGYVNPYDWC